MMRNSCDVIEKLFLVGKIQNCSGFPLFFICLLKFGRLLYF